MINGLEGIPGSGKSYEAVVYHVLAALQGGRKVITNLPLVRDMFVAMDPAFGALLELRARPQPILGWWDSKAVGTERPMFVLDGRKEEPSEEANIFGTVWDYYSDWKDADGRGPVFAIDECHVPLPKIGTEKQVVEWFKSHRHFNADVLLMTPGFRDVCPAIAGLMGVVVKVRKADILGRADHYIRKVHAGYRGAVISTEERKYLPQMFSLWKSHTQGNSVAEAGVTDVAPLSVKLARVTRLVWGVAGVAVAFAVWYTFFRSDPKPQAIATASIKVVDRAPPASAPPSSPVVVTAQAVASSPPGRAASAVDEEPDPYKAKGLHVTGRLRQGDRDLFVFAIGDGGRVIGSVTSAELVEAGFTWRSLTDCAGFLRWRQAALRTVTCDAPALGGGSNDRPVVILTPQPKSSPS